MVLIREALQCLGILLRAHARKMPSAALDRAEMDHLRDAVGEVIAAYPPAALKVRALACGWSPRFGYTYRNTGRPRSTGRQSAHPHPHPHTTAAQPTTQITDLVLRAWPFGQSTREVGFLQLLGSVLASAPLLHHIDDRTRLPLRAFARVAACLRSPHAGVAEEALLTCSNPRLISLYVGTNAPGAGPQGMEVPGMVKAALAQNAQGHWNGDVREESDRLLSMLVAADAAAAVMGGAGARGGKGKKLKVGGGGAGMKGMVAAAERGGGERTVVQGGFVV